MLLTLAISVFSQAFRCFSLQQNTSSVRFSCDLETEKAPFRRNESRDGAHVHDFCTTNKAAMLFILLQDKLPEQIQSIQLPSTGIATALGIDAGGVDAAMP